MSYIIKRGQNIVLGSITENEFNKTMTSWTHSCRKGSEIKMVNVWARLELVLAEKKNALLHCIHGAFKLLWVIEKKKPF